MTAPQEKPGLQAERTLLSWERTALGFLVGGAIPLFREHGPLHVGRALLAAMAVAAALLVIGLGRARARRIGRTRVVAGTPVVPAPGRAVLLTGAVVAGFAATVAVIMLLR
ncbi:MAG: DUF202 domain-containing protein [Actinobacteria bacterium]|nr:DUF202 domain-containing protein [Actinomycetota bacterium]